jgi:5-oxoprolinase (ATP-hydrolysing) subunit A
MIIDINCDLGELVPDNGNDEAIMPYITSVNIACSMHAGDPLTMMKTVMLAMKNGVAVGAHPGYPDHEGFGRVSIEMSDDELRATILFQAGALKTIAEAAGGKLHHVKCHGALYNDASSDYHKSAVIARAIRDIDSSLILIGLSGSEQIRAAKDIGLQTGAEVFADREYNDDGSLVSRRLLGAVLHDKELIVRRAIRMVKERDVVTINGKTITIEADTICIHGDNPAAREFAGALLAAFRREGIDVRSLKR